MCLKSGAGDGTRTRTPYSGRFSYHFVFRRQDQLLAASLSSGFQLLVCGLDCVFTVKMNSYRWAGMMHLQITFWPIHFFRYFPYSLYTFLGTIISYAHWRISMIGYTSFKLLEQGLARRWHIIPY